MLTLFSIPKPFHGHIATIQRNAIKSWTMLQGTEVVLFGQDEGTAEAAKEFGSRYVPDIERNEYGTPLLNDLFYKAQSLADGQLCYVNADIILMDDFIQAVRVVVSTRPRFLMVGQRWDLEMKAPFEFVSGWQEQLRSRLRGESSRHGKMGIDYFVFQPGLYRDIPPFAIGRTVWDNWLISRALALGVPVIDATDVVTAVHQNHDYQHNKHGVDGVWKGPERDANMKLAGGWDYVFNLKHADWLLTPAGLRRPRLTREHLLHRLDNLRVRRPHLGPVAKLARRLLAPGNLARSVESRLKRASRLTGSPDIE